MCKIEVRNYFLVRSLLRLHIKGSFYSIQPRSRATHFVTFGSIYPIEYIPTSQISDSLNIFATF